METAKTQKEVISVCAQQDTIHLMVQIRIAQVC